MFVNQNIIQLELKRPKLL